QITFAQPADQQLGSGPVTVQATASSGLTVSISSLTPSICSVSGSSVTVKAVGTCTLRASQAGDGISYSTAASVFRSFEVTPRPQYVWSTFAQTATLVIGQ